MDKIKALIIDDEAPAREIIKHYLKSHEDIVMAGECPDGFSGLKAIRETGPDLVFLDIQMPRLTGFEMLEVMEGNPVIIFTTAYDQYALRAFEMNAVDYLLKPISAERFNGAVAKAREKIAASSKKSEKPSSLIRNTPRHEQSLTRIVVRKGNAINIIPVDDIRYLEAQDDYVMIYHAGGKALKQQRMRYFEENLPARQFVRIHRSYIVRVDAIAKLEPYGKENYVAILKGGEKFPVSKNGYKILRDELSGG
ncbi:MAG: LytTR family transcriptional regulator DNA-binding domain-containing protein [Bacteroidales bacterium]|jgi:two-component system LytT family response regulator|nr:LytTR family transcriptional regulator DNA-binding domain-containing protein [Bacteroidales bacterium]